jgi:pimeloyl-ACP methyl ester carboxylesterase
LIAHAENDFQTVEASKTDTKFLPNTVFKTIRNAGYFSFYDQPQAFRKMIQAFLGSRQ